MKICDAITTYLNHQRERGLTIATLSTTKKALLTFFEPHLDDNTHHLTVTLIEQLSRNLAHRESSITRRHLAVSTQQLYTSISKAFAMWFNQEEWLKRSPMHRLKRVLNNKQRPNVTEDATRPRFGVQPPFSRK